MAFDLTGKRIVVTGAGQGIGKGIVLALAKAGARVVAVSKTKLNLYQLAVEVPGVETISVDLSDWDATRAALADVGPVDGLVNNAGVSNAQPFLEMTKENYERYPILAQYLSGCEIIDVSDLTLAYKNRKVDRAVPGLVSYSSSKAAVDQATKVMALELGPHNIRVNCVNPSTIRTAMTEAWIDLGKLDPILARTPLAKIGEPQDIADAVMFLLCDKSRLINGVTLPIDGGLLVT